MTSDDKETANGRPEADQEAARLEFARNAAKGFHAIGRFTFEFSQLQFTIRIVLHAALALNDDYFDLVSAPYDFATLCNVTREILTLQWPERKARIEEIFKRCLAVNDARVRVAHGTWTLGGEGPTARYTDRRRWQARFYFERADELDALSEEAQALTQALLFLDDRGTPAANLSSVT